MRTQEIVCVKGPAQLMATDVGQGAPPSPCLFTKAASLCLDPASHPTPEGRGARRPILTLEVASTQRPEAAQIHGMSMSRCIWGQRETEYVKRQQSGGHSLAFGPFFNDFDSRAHQWAFVVLKAHGLPPRPAEARASGPGPKAGPGVGQAERQQGEGSVAHVMPPGFAHTCQG